MSGTGKGGRNPLRLKLRGSRTRCAEQSWQPGVSFLTLPNWGRWVWEAFNLIFNRFVSIVRFRNASINLIFRQIVYIKSTEDAKCKCVEFKCCFSVIAVSKYLQPCAQILAIKLTCAATSVDANVLVASFQIWFLICFEWNRHPFFWFFLQYLICGCAGLVWWISLGNWLSKYLHLQIMPNQKSQINVSETVAQSKWIRDVPASLNLSGGWKKAEDTYFGAWDIRLVKFSLVELLKID